MKEDKEKARKKAVENLEKFKKAVDDFEKAVKEGKIAPPTSKGIWK